MEKSRKEENADEQEQRRQTALLAPVAPERELPHVSAEKEKQPEVQAEKRKQPEPGSDADAELTLMLKQIEGYFTRQARNHDLEAISFSLRHLFSRVDFLYRQALPALNTWTSRATSEKEMLLNQQIWLHLQEVNRTLDRMAPLCHLLSDVIECLLDTLDNEELWLRTFEEEETLLLQQVHLPASGRKRSTAASDTEETAGSSAIDPEIWDRSVSTLMDRLVIWQEQHHKLASFQEQFAEPTLTTHDLSELDAAFATLLDSAGAIFGDILPNFRLIGTEDHEEISALLFDLMQQSDQMLVQFEVTLEPLNSLLRHFAAVSENN
jgi:hypothetical protein